MKIVDTTKGLVARIRTLFQLESSQKKVSVTSPRQLSFQEWRYALLHTRKALKDKRIPILSAGVAYFATLAFFPLIAAAVAIAAFVIDPNHLQHILTSVEQYLPHDIATLLGNQLKAALGHHKSNIIVAVVAIFISLVSVSGAMKNLINATNVAYEQHETRPFLRVRLLSLLMTLGSLVAGACIIALLLINDTALRHIGVPELFIDIFSYLRWVILAILMTACLAIFYRYAPNMKNPHWQWVSWGAGIATVIWLLGSALFFLYAKYFADFSHTYSLFAGIIVLMIWLNLSSFIILLGAEINHRLSLRTTRKTTA